MGRSPLTEEKALIASVEQFDSVLSVGYGLPVCWATSLSAAKPSGSGVIAPLWQPAWYLFVENLVQFKSNATPSTRQRQAIDIASLVDLAQQPPRSRLPLNRA